MSELQDLITRQRDIIQNTCNTVGCRNCDLKNGNSSKDGCASTDLQDRITDLEMEIAKAGGSP